MKNDKFSICIRLAHAFSAMYADNLHHEEISPDLLFCGLTKLQDFEAYAAIHDDLRSTLPVAIPEIHQLVDLLHSHHIDPRQARRNLVERIGSGVHMRTEAEHVHRSEDTRQIFNRAATLALEKPLPYATLGQLLAALLEDGETQIHGLLTKIGVDIEGLKNDAMLLEPKSSIEQQEEHSTVITEELSVSTDKTIHLTLFYKNKFLEDSKEFTHSPVIIGRPKKGISVDLDLSPDVKVSRPHLELEFKSGAWWAKSLSKGNPTYLNDVKISQPVKLTPGDKLFLGQSTLYIDVRLGDLEGVIEQERPIEAEMQQTEEVSDKEQLDIDFRIGRIFSRIHNIDHLWDLLLDEMALAFPDSINQSVILYDEGVLIPKLGQERTFSPFSRGLATRAVIRREAFIWQRRTSTESEKQLSSLKEVVSAIYVPIIIDGAVECILEVQRGLSGPAFSSKDLEKLRLIATEITDYIKEQRHQVRFKRVFVLHIEKDRGLAIKLKEGLIRSGIRAVLYEEEVHVGDLVGPRIVSAIQRADGVIFVLSENSVDSNKLHNALQLALKEKARILPLLVGNVGLPEELHGVSPVVLNNLESDLWVEELQQVIKALEHKPMRIDKKPSAKVILFMALNPDEDLNLAEEIHQIDEKIRKAEFRERFKIEQAWAVRANEIQSALMRHKPHVVHFSGHGTNTGELVFQDEAGNPMPVSKRALTDLFATLKDNIQCVVLNACWSQKQAEGIAVRIPCVVGMGRGISDDAAIVFAAKFYESIAYNRSVSEAFDLARNLVDPAMLAETDTPKLICREDVDPDNYFLLD